MSDAPRCYRHPDRETLVSCSECGRPICEDCMTFAPVGIRCPDHSSVGIPKGNAARTVRTMQRKAVRSGAPVTVVLIALNVIIYAITASQGHGINDPNGSLYKKWDLYGPYVGRGDWWRVVTSAFLHGNVIHLGLNMFVLWFVGSVVEQSIGRWRYLALYLVSGIAGSAGALLLDPNLHTIGASGAIFGLFGTLLILEWVQTGSLAGQALMLILFNLVFTLTVPGISVGGHLGGLAGGIIASLALVQAIRFRQPLIAVAGLVAVGGMSIVIAYAQVHGHL